MKLKNTFQKTFFKKEKYKFINIVDELIDRLPPEQDKWTIMGLINYLDVLVTIFTKDSPTSYKTGGYIIFNLGLLDKLDNELFFAIKGKEDETYECINNKYFFTKKELEEIDDIKGILNSTKKNYINEDDYYKVIQDVKKSDFSINIHDNYLKKKDGNYLGGWQHIIIDGCDNFPLDIINIILDQQYTYIGKDVVPDMRNDLEKKVYKFNCIKEIIKRAIDRSVIKAKKDITMIAPIYHSAGNQAELSFLLPLYLLRKEKPDCALVFNYIPRTNEYQGISLLNMKEALQDARVFYSSKQYSWLRE